MKQILKALGHGVLWHFVCAELATVASNGQGRALSKSQGAFAVEALSVAEPVGHDLFEAGDDGGSRTALEAGALELDERGAVDLHDFVLALGKDVDLFQITL